MSATPQRRGALVPHPSGHRGTLRTPEGEELPVQTYDRGGEVVLVVLTQLQEPPLAEALDPATLEYASVRGIVRLQGEAVFSDDSLVRFHAEGEPEVIQRRAFVRVPAVRDVQLGVTLAGGPHRAHTLDLSGGGMLLSGADHLVVGDTVSFEMRFGEDGATAAGLARVVRIDGSGRRGLRFEQITEDDRQRLIRFVFECMRAARARTRGDLV